MLRRARTVSDALEGQEPGRLCDATDRTRLLGDLVALQCSGSRTTGIDGETSAQSYGRSSWYDNIIRHANVDSHASRKL